MAKKSFNIQLKGYVGGWDFNRSDVDDTLANNPDSEVNVLIDSLGGSLATGLSISAAFRNHGKVNVHFVGLNASAATIASLGASHISIDAGAMYLAHKCSTTFFEWASLNADQFETLIADCEKIKADLDKLDLNVARLYAKKCNKPVEDLLALMKVGGWLTAQEALDWGFVDEITDLDDDETPMMTNAIAADMATAGIPIPNIPIAEADKDSPFARFLSAISSFFKPTQNSISKAMNKTYACICALLGIEAIALTDNNASLSDEQLSALEDHIADLGKKVEDRDKTIADLQAKLDKKPAVETTNVVDESKHSASEASAIDDYIATAASANDLFNSIP